MNLKDWEVLCYRKTFRICSPKSLKEENFMPCIILQIFKSMPEAWLFYLRPHLACVHWISVKMVTGMKRNSQAPLRRLSDPITVQALEPVVSKRYHRQPSGQQVVAVREYHY